ncbi:MAG: 16S rRNA (uracil(1498)-N(3))-methyltransferase [Solobacterium sp.]|nr:16S rRNA (uracil(1498)-N(3))-methyltransferase [Solobacterium sp.]
MQQYFSDTKLAPGAVYEMTPQQAHHAGNVVHLQGKIIRLVHNGEAYFARCEGNGRKMTALVLEKDPVKRELDAELVLLQALVRREKFEWILQKATELGVSRIIPFESSRCVVQYRKEKAERQKERWMQIVTEAAEQSKREKIPVIDDVLRFEDVCRFEAEEKYLAYENAFGESPLLGSVYTGESAAFVIGPEGGFSEEEVQALVSGGYRTVTLGARILRAETAALAALAVMADTAERKQR